VPVTEADLKPTVDEVALLLRTRTVGYLPQAGGLGSDTGPGDYTTFDGTTRPTDTEVEMIIDQSWQTVFGMLDMALFDIADYQAPMVRHAGALYAAILIETSFFRETFNQALIDLWRDLLKDTVTAVQGGGTGEAGSQKYRWGSLPIGSILVGPEALPSPYANSDFMPGVDDYVQPILVEVVGNPAHNAGDS